MFSTRVALTDDNVKVVTVPEGVPDRVPQELTCVALDEGKLLWSGVAPGRTHQADQTLCPGLALLFSS